MARGQGAPRTDWDPRGIAPKHRNLAQALGARGYTRETFAREMGVTRGVMDNWIDGCLSPGSGIPNAKLAEAACWLDVSVWYLLGLTDSEDGAGARPFRSSEDVTEMWQAVQSPDTAMPYADPRFECIEKVEPGDPDYGNWFTWITAKEYAASPDRYEPIPGTRTDVFKRRCSNGDIAYVNMETLEQRYRERKAESADGCAGLTFSQFVDEIRKHAADELRSFLMQLHGDYRDPAGVLAALARYAAGRDVYRLDDAAVMMDRQLRKPTGQS